MSNIESNKSNAIRFISGAFASCTAEMATLPIDISKVRLQSQGMLATTSSGAPAYRGMFHALYKISLEEGPLALWKGAIPALLRQTSYSSLCMMWYEPFRNALVDPKTKAQDIPYLTKLAAGGGAGAISIAFANPIDVIKVRMQADKTGTLYKGTLDAFKNIAKHEGWTGFMKGVWPNIQRGFIVNAAELGTYDHSKQSLIQSGYVKDGIWAHLGASLIAGFAGAAASNPVDVLKTRLMTQPHNPDGSGQYYRGMMDCAMKSIRKEGIMVLYNGFLPNWMRKGPWCVLFFVSYEKYRKSMEMEFLSEEELMNL